MKFAYADPPYIGQAKRHYGCEEVDHGELIARLQTDFPDGWALSASSTTLREILPMCPPDVRIAAWVKSFCAFKRNVRPAYAWEPVIYRGGRNPVNGYRAACPERNGKQTTPKDFIIEPITLRKGLVGAKPIKVCRWILDLLNVSPGDEVIDLYPGTGIMGKVSMSVTQNPMALICSLCGHYKFNHQKINGCTHYVESAKAECGCSAREATR